MIEDEHEWFVVCDAGKLKKSVESKGCWGRGPRQWSLDDAVAGAKAEGFVPLPDGKHHFCRECAKSNQGLLGGTS